MPRTTAWKLVTSAPGFMWRVLVDNRQAMGFYASVNGEITPAEEARVSVLDNGFTFGDAVYETLRTYGGRPFHLDRHLERLRASAARLGFTAPFDDEVFARRRDELLARAGNEESYIRI